METTSPTRSLKKVPLHINTELAISPRSEVSSLFKTEVNFLVSKMDLKDYSKFKSFVHNYLDRHYSSSFVKDKMKLSEEEFEQLFDFQNNDATTNEASIHLKPKNQDDILNFEVKRSLLRLNIFHLYLNDDPLNKVPRCYLEFIQNQPKSEEIHLNLDTFQKLSFEMKSLSTAAKEALRASCFIKMSRQSMEEAAKLGLKFSTTTENFISDIILQRPDLFPVYKTLNEDAKSLMPYIFLKNSFARHMQLHEGGQSMFVVLKEKIKGGEIDLVKNRERIHAWKMRIIIEDSAFEMLGIHPDTNEVCRPQGSSNMKQHVALDYLKLFEEVDKFIRHNADYDILENLLQYKGKQFGIKNNYLIQLGAQLRLTKKEEVETLKKWFENLSVEKKTLYLQTYQSFFESEEVPTPTYEPAVFKNLILKLNLDFETSLDIYAAIMTKVHVLYLHKVSKKLIDPTQSPLNFNSFLIKNDGDQLYLVVDQYHKNKFILNFDVNAEGIVFLTNKI